jgi:hypothetical protein
LSDEQMSISKMNASVSCNAGCHREHCSIIRNKIHMEWVRGPKDATVL